MIQAYVLVGDRHWQDAVTGRNLSRFLFGGKATEFTFAKLVAATSQALSESAAR